MGRPDVALLHNKPGRNPPDENEGTLSKNAVH